MRDVLCKELTFIAPSFYDESLSHFTPHSTGAFFFLQPNFYLVSLGNSILQIQAFTADEIWNWRIVNNPIVEC